MVASLGNLVHIDEILPISKTSVVINHTAMECLHATGGFLDWNASGNINTNPFDGEDLKVRAGISRSNKVNQYLLAITATNRNITAGGVQDFFFRDIRYNQGDWLASSATASAVSTNHNLTCITRFDTESDNGHIQVFNNSTTDFSGTFHLNILYPNRVKGVPLNP